MSDDFGLPPAPLMTAKRAQDIARAYKALANNLAELEPGEAARVERQSLWWMSYAIGLAGTKPKDEP